MTKHKVRPRVQIVYFDLICELVNEDYVTSYNGGEKRVTININSYGDAELE